MDIPATTGCGWAYTGVCGGGGVGGGPGKRIRVGGRHRDERTSTREVETTLPCDEETWTWRPGR